MFSRARSAALLLLPLIALVFAGCATSHPPVPAERSLSLDEKVGQLIVITADGRFMNEESPEFQRLLHQVRDNHVGGIHWYNADVYETAWLNRQLQAASKVPLLVSADLEAGIGMRFIDTTYWPWAMAVGATGDPAYAEKMGGVTADDAKLVGINQVYAPVADVNNDPDNPVINVRSFGEDPADVARFVAAFVRGVQSEGVLATAKHFPGHGDTHTDSHRSVPVVDVSRERLESTELVPFRAAIAAGVGSIMPAHVSYPALDSTPVPVRTNLTPKQNPYGAGIDEVAQNTTRPATVSPKIVHDLLRGELGFKGLVVTDSLGMGGITLHYAPGDAAVLAIEAGVDQLLNSPDTDEAIEGVKEAVADGRISRARIDESVARILEAKSRVSPPADSQEEIFRALDSPQKKALAAEIAQRSLTLVRQQEGALPLDRGAKVVEMVVSDFLEAVPPLLDLRRELRARLENAPDRFYFDRRSTADDQAQFLEAAKNADVVLVESVVRLRSGEGHISMPELAHQTLLQLPNATSARIEMISFGTPYIVRDVPWMPTYLIAWGPQPVMQVAAARALFGEAPVSGHTPVTIPGICDRGWGIVTAPVAAGTR
ncbi:MAG: glycoside hydrolase family 3 N-terminal domain-containing protein [Thermoanaerobaculia bacterium]